MSILAAVNELNKEIERITKIRDSLLVGTTALSVPVAPVAASPAKKAAKKTSAKKVAKKAAKKAATVSAVAPAKKRVMSAATKKKISEAHKRRAAEAQEGRIRAIDDVLRCCARSAHRRTRASRSECGAGSALLSCPVPKKQ